MKRKIIIPLLVIFGGLGLTIGSSLRTSTANETIRDIPDVIVLGEKASLGKVTFTHADHITQNRSVDGTAALKCVDCHHVEQPLSEAVKVPPYKTVYPADRTATLTADSLKDPATPAVTTCRGCHIRKGEEPKILTEVPKIENEKTGKTIVLDNKNAFHANCTDCHNAVIKARPEAKAPKSNKCMTCHVRAK
jgi:cytochrome c553